MTEPIVEECCSSILCTEVVDIASEGSLVIIIQTSRRYNSHVVVFTLILDHTACTQWIDAAYFYRCRTLRDLRVCVLCKNG